MFYLIRDWFSGRIHWCGQGDLPTPELVQGTILCMGNWESISFLYRQLYRE